MLSYAGARRLVGVIAVSLVLMQQEETLHYGYFVGQLLARTRDGQLSPIAYTWYILHTNSVLRAARKNGFLFYRFCFTWSLFSFRFVCKVTRMKVLHFFYVIIKLYLTVTLKVRRGFWCR